MPKGYKEGKKIEYFKEPQPITIDYSCNNRCYCDNCGGVDNVFKIHFNHINVSYNYSAINKQLWLCEDCFKELINAIKPALLQALNMDVKTLEEQLKELESE